MPSNSGATLVRGEIDLLPFVTLTPGQGDEWMGQDDHVRMLWRAMLDTNEGRFEVIEEVNPSVH
jgi:hypothetical protein